MVKKYGLTLFTSADESLERYIQSVMKQVQGELRSPVRSAFSWLTLARPTSSLDDGGQAGQLGADLDDKRNA